MFIYVLATSYIIYSLYPTVFIIMFLLYKNSCDEYVLTCDFIENYLYMEYNLAILSFLLLTTVFYFLEKLVVYILNKIIEFLDYFLGITEY